MVSADAATLAVRTVPTGKDVVNGCDVLTISKSPELPERVTAPREAVPSTAFATTAGLNCPSGPKTAALSTSMTDDGGVKGEVTVAETVTVLVDCSLIDLTLSFSTLV